MTHHDSNPIDLSTFSVVNDSSLITYLFASSLQQQRTFNTPSPHVPTSSSPSTASTNASFTDLVTPTMPHTTNTNGSSSHRAAPLPPSLIVEPSIPAACASLLSLRSGGRRPHPSSSDGNLPMLTTALTLLEHAGSAKHQPKRPSSSNGKSSGSRFWDTVLPVSKEYSSAAPSRSRPSSSSTNHTSKPPSNTRSTNVSAEDESAKMNIPCVVCGVRFRKPGHLNMHWRSVHATSADAVYPGKLQPRSTPPATTTTTTTTSQSSSGSGSGSGTRIAKGKGVRPYGCPQCSSRFRRGSDRNRHMRMVHAKIRPFECSQCGSHFGRKSFLEAHISTVHEKQRPYRCECGAAFGQRSSLTRHARKIHGTS